MSLAPRTLRRLWGAQPRPPGTRRPATDCPSLGVSCLVLLVEVKALLPPWVRGLQAKARTAKGVKSCSGAPSTPEESLSLQAEARGPL